MHISLEKSQVAIAKLRKPPIRHIVILALHGTNRKSIINDFIDQYSDLKKVIDHSTKEKEPHEIHGLDHYFCKEKEFKKIDLIDGTVQTVYAGCHSGITLSEVKRLVKSEKQGLFVVSSVKSMAAIYKLFGGNVSVIYITADYGYRYKNIYRKYADTKDSNIKLQHTMSFVDDQERELEDPFKARLIHYTLHVKPGMPSFESADCIAGYLKSLDQIPVMA